MFWIYKELPLCIDLNASGMIQFSRDCSIVMAPDLSRSSLHSVIKEYPRCPFLDFFYFVFVILLTAEVPNYWAISKIAQNKALVNHLYTFRSKFLDIWKAHLAIWQL